MYTSIAVKYLLMFEDAFSNVTLDIARGDDPKQVQTNKLYKLHKTISVTIPLRKEHKTIETLVKKKTTLFIMRNLEAIIVAWDKRFTPEFHKLFLTRRKVR